jgi:hypothetical protein
MGETVESIPLPIHSLPLFETKPSACRLREQSVIRLKSESGATTKLATKGNTGSEMMSLWLLSVARRLRLKTQGSSLPDYRRPTLKT